MAKSGAVSLARTAAMRSMGAMRAVVAAVSGYPPTMTQAILTARNAGLRRVRKARSCHGHGDLRTRATMVAGMMGRTTAPAFHVSLASRFATTTSKPGAAMVLRPAFREPAPASIPAPQSGSGTDRTSRYRELGALDRVGAHGHCGRQR